MRRSRRRRSTPPGPSVSTLRSGSIEVGKRGDLLLLDGPVEQIAYRFGHNPVAIAFVAGEPVYVRDERAADRIRRR